MDLKLLVGSAVVAAVVSSLGAFLTRFLVDTRIEIMKAEFGRELETVKSDLSVWATFRNETIRQMWEAHRQIVAGMTKVILRVQALQPSEVGKATDAIGDYRTLVHQHIDLLSPADVAICQRFLDSAYAIASGDAPSEDALALKAIRTDFYGQMAETFHLQEVMPWLTPRTAGVDRSP